MNWDKERIESYLEILRKNILPKLKYKIMWNEGRDFRMADTFEVYENSKYFYKGAHLFLHFTTIPNLINILREKKIRLYSLEGMDDKDEFSGSFSRLDTEIDDWRIKEIKKSIFVLSMCEYDVEKQKESLNLWREYGNDGNDVAIVFKIKSKQKHHWVHYMLSKIYYDEKELTPFINAANEIKTLEKGNSFSESHFHIALYRLFAFHKQNIYKHEREVRLLYSEGFTSRDREKAKADFKKNQNTYYVERELEYEPDNDLLKRIDTDKVFTDKKEFRKIAYNVFPHLSIHKILFGYRIANKVKWELRETIREVMGKGDYKNVPVLDDSSLFEYFNNTNKKSK